MEQTKIPPLSAKQRAHYLWLAKNTTGLLKALTEKGSILCDDKDFVKVCLINDPLALKWVSPKLKEDFGLIKLAIKNNLEAINFVPESMSNKFEFWENLKRIGFSVHGMSSYIKSGLLKTVDDFKRVEFFFKKDSYCDLSRVGQDVLKDEKIAKRILSERLDAISEFPEELKSNKKFIKSLPKSVFHYYARLGECVRDDEVFFLEAIKINAANFLSASERIKNDKKILRRGLVIEPSIYNYFTLEQRNEEELFFQMIRSAKKLNYFDLVYKPKDSWCKDKRVAKVCTSLDPTIIRAFVQFNDDEEIVKNALSKNGSAYSFIDEKLKNKKEFALLALKSSPYIIEEFPEELKRDEDCCREALESSGWTYADLDESMKSKKEFLLIAINESKDLIASVHEDLRDDEDVIKAAISGDTFNLFSDEVRSGIIRSNKLDEDGKINFRESAIWYLENKKATECKQLLEFNLDNKKTIESDKNSKVGTMKKQGLPRL